MLSLPFSFRNTMSVWHPGEENLISQCHYDKLLKVESISHFSSSFVRSSRAMQSTMEEKENLLPLSTMIFFQVLKLIPSSCVCFKPGKKRLIIKTNSPLIFRPSRAARAFAEKKRTEKK